MAVFRVEKTDNYMVMSNYHLRDRSISLKAKGLLSQMLSLPPEWDYTLQGLAYINKEGINSVREGVKELEKAGYIKRRRVRGDKGLFAGNEYVIRELPESEKPSYENRTLDNRTLENPTSSTFPGISENHTGRFVSSSSTSTILVWQTEAAVP